MSSILYLEGNLILFFFLAVQNRKMKLKLFAHYHQVNSWFATIWSIDPLSSILDCCNEHLCVRVDEHVNP